MIRPSCPMTRVRWLGVWISAIVTTSCMLSPRNEQSYPTTSSTIAFLAFTQWEDAPIKFETAVFGAGGSVEGWNALGGCIAESGPIFDGEGTPHYYCAVNAQLPAGSWTTIGVPPGHAYRAQARVRVRDPDTGAWHGGFYFDNDAATTQCILTEMEGSGANVPIRCATGESSATLYADAAGS